jgi:hypothetical protein
MPSDRFFLDTRPQDSYFLGSRQHSSLSHGIYKCRTVLYSECSHKYLGNNGLQGGTCTVTNVQWKMSCLCRIISNRKMSHVTTSRNRIHPVSEEERRLIRNEVTELLKSPHFSNSKRYPALLSYVVEKTLAGRSDELKERVLGVEVFHRPADYDSSSDTVVRVAAGEVRRRLALVYHESEGEQTIEISLPTGSYVPEFHRITSQELALSPILSTPALRQPIPLTGFEKPILTSAPAPLRSMWRKPGAALALVVLAAGFVALFVHLRAAARQTSVDLFWQPVHASSNAALICPGAMVRAANTSYGLAIAHRTDDYTFTSMATTVAVAGLVNLFSKNHTEYIVQPTSATTLTDMREHPVILIGAYNNEWTLRLQSDLRYRFTPDPARQIYDGMNPSTTWMRPASLPFLEEDDFAIVGRFHSKLTDGLVVLIAGIGKNGTEAAAQFVTTPRYMDLLNQQSKDWASKNVEIVLKTKVIHGKSGAPSIEAVYVW